MRILKLALVVLALITTYPGFAFWLNADDGTKDAYLDNPTGYTPQWIMLYGDGFTGDDLKRVVLNDSVYISYVGDTARPYKLIMVVFDKPANMASSTLYSEFWAYGQSNLTVYTWDDTNAEWDSLYSHSSAHPCSYTNNVQSKWGSNNLIVLAVSNVGTGGTNWIRSDWCRVSYTTSKGDLGDISGSDPLMTGIESTSLGELKAVFK